MSTPSKPKTNWTLFGAIAAAIAGSICCVGPLLLLALGIGGAWVGNLKVLEPFRPWFMLTALIFLAVGFYRVYRKPKPEECKEGSYCAKPHAGRMNKIGLWIALVFVLGLFAYPGIAAKWATRNASCCPQNMEQSATLDVKGMSCAGCVATVTASLKKLDGVGGVHVTLEPPQAVVQYNPALVTPAEMEAATANAGHISNTQNGESK